MSCETARIADHTRLGPYSPVGLYVCMYVCMYENKVPVVRYPHESVEKPTASFAVQPNISCIQSYIHTYMHAYIHTYNTIHDMTCIPVAAIVPVG